MERNDHYRELEKAFIGTFIEELMPGVLHNFANPLNGIMGRSKLLQRRLTDAMEKLKMYSPELAERIGEEKIIKDVNNIASEADRFFDIFRALAGKFSNLAGRETESINLSHLVEAETQFADFYLDFKHDIRKILHLEEDLPDVVGVRADYSLCISTLLNSARKRMKNRPEKVLSIATGHDETHVALTLEDRGSAISEACCKSLKASGSMEVAGLDPGADYGVHQALLLLRQYHAQAEIQSEDGHTVISLRIPYGKERVKES